ncbi:ABC-type sugar transport system, ATPase component [Halobacteroides halobius DSM 5150]|uniref:ABC-type sugar transport system, ATPase component n=1 Tax=Halobacteroides halobius (strain ATCC 35273 / DSM 5150 / MD-1) TaxID=748449 RepID=L0KCW9_HALHC|nr:sugar ABC transporter ATP-binding protein [Halobacteroides halobius]AGB42385.1 ABC-type sugar transport system, ATPase component [Halobacteroides halobius DSM 5150]
MIEPFLKIKNLTKEFPGVRALDGVDLEIKRGEVHAILGENGAGKSTLIKVLTGVHTPTEGEIYIEGKKLEDNDPQKALEQLGITPIYQELNLIPQLDVTENIFMGREKSKNEILGWIDRERMEEETKKILSRLGQESISPNDLIRDLGVGKQQMVEISKALSVETKLLILDEPTSSLGKDETKELFDTMGTLKKQGVTMIFISHKLDEVKKMADRVTVLRNGKYIITDRVDNLTEDKMISYMVGEDVDNKFPKMKVEPGKESLRVENLNRKGVLNNVSFKAYEGEVLGIAGLVGAGRTEIARAIVGADSKDSGDIYVHGKKVKIDSPKVALENGIALLTEDRKEQGLFLKQSVKFNIASSNLKKYRENGFLNLQEQRKDAIRMVDNLNIKTPNVQTKCLQLSGGNQQKVVIGKWLNTEANIFIFDEPTRGIDVGAKVEVFNIINDLVKKGNTVIMISSELPEILNMSDRILVVHEGKITGRFNTDEASKEKIMSAATGGIKDVS